MGLSLSLSVNLQADTACSVKQCSFSSKIQDSSGRSSHLIGTRIPSAWLRLITISNADPCPTTLLSMLSISTGKARINTSNSPWRNAANKLVVVSSRNSKFNCGKRWLASWTKSHRRNGAKGRNTISTLATALASRLHYIDSLVSGRTRPFANNSRPCFTTNSPAWVKTSGLFYLSGKEDKPISSSRFWMPLLMSDWLTKTAIRSVTKVTGFVKSNKIVKPG